MILTSGMKVKPCDPSTAAGLIDPVTRRSPFVDSETRQVLPEAEVPETSFWIRRLIAGEIKRTDSAPTGREPIASLTTR